MAILNGTGTDLTDVMPVGFRIRRASPTLGGYRPLVDQVVADELKTLNELLLKKVVAPGDLAELKALVDRRLTPRRAATASRVGVARWADGSLCDKLRDLKPGAGEESIGEILADEAKAADLRYEFAAAAERAKESLTLEQRAVLTLPGIRDLILARAVLGHGLMQVKSLMNFALKEPDGVAEIVAYAAASAGREYVQRRRLRVPNIDDDKSPAVIQLAQSQLSFAADTFEDRAVEIAADAAANADYEQRIKDAKVDESKITPNQRIRLIEYIKTSPVTVTKDNAAFMVPMYLLKAASVEPATAADHPVWGSTADDPFRVSFFVEDTQQLQISTAAVRCASQLYYVMTLGDELGVFDAVRHFTNNYLFRQGFAIEDKVLRRDLENYVFSEQFPGYDAVDGEVRMMRCTREGERGSFYRQVFDLGNEDVPGDAPPNSDFGRLWKILVLESARYLERAQASPHPESYVSPQNVMQAVEDLQYNLSTSCVGMATVMTPLMYAELDFVVNRILGHKEVRRHLVPAGGSWWKVVEKLAADRNGRVRASVLYNKARLGYTLIRDIADYTPSRFEQDDAFSRFISNVDAFITTQSILQEDAEEDEKGDEHRTSGWGGASGMPSIPGLPKNLPGMPDMPGTPWSNGGQGDRGYGGATVPSGGPGNGPSPSGGDEWDF